MTTKKKAKKAVKRVAPKGKKKAKKVVKKAVKRAVRETAKKKAVKKTTSKKRPAAKKTVSRKASAAKPVGKVIHFYGGIKVAVIKFFKPVKLGTQVQLKGATTDFSQKLDSMQYDHKPVKMAPKGKEVGVKVKSRVREGDQVYL
jgi:hypothetical protein